MKSKISNGSSTAMVKRTKGDSASAHASGKNEKALASSRSLDLQSKVGEEDAHARKYVGDSEEN
jgi:hypothetical protein